MRKEPVIIDRKSLVPSKHFLRKIEQVMNQADRACRIQSPFFFGRLCSDRERPYDQKIIAWKISIAFLIGYCYNKQELNTQMVGAPVPLSCGAGGKRETGERPVL